MLTEFDEWLSRRVSKERSVVIQDAIELLSMLADHRVEDVAINAIMASQSLTTDTVLDGISVDLKEYSLTIPLEYGVTLNSDQFTYSDQGAVNKILFTLTQVDEWEDHQRILGLLQQDESNEEIFASLCEEIASIDVEEVLNLVLHVDADTIEKLQEHYLNKVASSQDSYVQPVWRSTLLQYVNTFSLSNSGIAEYIKEDNTLGLTFTQYCDMFVSNFFTNKDIKFQAMNWILMSVASGTVEEDLIYTQCVAMFDETYSNLELQSKIAKAIKTILGVNGI